MHGIAVAILSVRPSVRCVYCEKNEIIVCQYLNTTQNRDISSLSTPMGVAGNCPLPPEIFAEIDPPPPSRIRQISTYNVSTVKDSEKFNHDE